LLRFWGRLRRPGRLGRPGPSDPPAAGASPGATPDGRSQSRHEPPLLIAIDDDGV
jgi:hypothetical protein